MSKVEIWPSSGIKGLSDRDPKEESSEIRGIKMIWKDLQADLKRNSPARLTEFSNRLNREWAIETGVIENLYDIDRGVTQTLIEQGFKAELMGHGSSDKPREYVLATLKSHMDTIDWLFDRVTTDDAISCFFIKQLHQLLTENQTTTEALTPDGRMTEIPLLRGQWKVQPNSPTREGITYEYCPPIKVEEEMQRLVEIHQQQVASNIPCEIQAAWLHHRFTQIHPFQDGNGRVARAITTLILIKGGLFPFTILREKRADYIAALEQADEGNLAALVRVIVKGQSRQYTRASGISEQIRDEQNLPQAARSLIEAAEKIAARKQAELEVVFRHSAGLVQYMEQSLEAISGTIKQALVTVSSESNPDVWITKSKQDTDHYFRSQIIELARTHFAYFANLSAHRSWITLNANWSRRFRLVFAIHGIGQPFNGSLICAPFIEFLDTDGDEHTSSGPLPLSDEGFVFYYSETQDQVIDRFRSWCDQALAVSLKEISRNL